MVVNDMSSRKLREEGNLLWPGEKLVEQAQTPVMAQADVWWITSNPAARRTVESWYTCVEWMWVFLWARACDMENREPQASKPPFEVKIASDPDEAESPPEPAAQALDGSNTTALPAKGGDSAEWGDGVARLVAEMRAWLDRNTYMPQWLPASWRHPWLVYLAAAVTGVLATIATVPIVALFPHFGFSGTVPLVGVVFFALQLGAAPGLVTTIVSAIVLYAVILAPTIQSPLDEESHIFGLLIYLAVNIAILVMASRTAQARRQAQEANEQMERFLGITSHELRTPLTSMKTNIQMAQRLSGRITGEQAQQAAQIQGLLARADGQVGRLGRLVDDLLDVSRIRSDKLELHVAQCDLVAIVRDITEEQRQAHPERTIELRLPARPALFVRADGARISQVLVNYLTNALKYSAEDQPVVVGLDVRGKIARVWVRDRGPGLPPDELARIWLPFHRAEKVTVLSGSGIGLGLGLHISRTIVERHGGEVGVRSEPGRGSIFWFTLPLQTLPLHAKKAQPASDDSPVRPDE